MHDYLQAFSLNQRLKDLGEEKLVKLIGEGIQIEDGEYCQHRCLGRCSHKKGAWRKDCIGFSPLLPH